MEIFKILVALKLFQLFLDESRIKSVSEERDVRG